MTLRDLSEKDVIQLKTGENLGRIDDLAFEDGQITPMLPSHVKKMNEKKERVRHER